MKTRFVLMGCIPVAMFLAACTGQNSGPSSSRADQNAATTGAHQVELVARGMQFEGPDSVPAGWTTFRFRNASAMTHFALVEHLPPGVTRADYEEIGALFQNAMDLINEGKPEAGMEVLKGAPTWLGRMYSIGGPGMTAPGHMSQATVYLEPGHYMIECYVKSDGVFHSYGAPSHPAMIHALTVVPGETKGEPPHADVHVTVDQDKGLSIDAAPAPGRRTFAVHFAKQTQHLMGPDVHLFRVNQEGDIERADAWMDAMAPKGMETPAPLQFLGGTEELPNGMTAYFTATLRPGRYALISEVAHAKQKGLLVTFTVSAPEGGTQGS